MLVLALVIPISSFSELAVQHSKVDKPLSIIPVEHTASWALEWWLPRHQQKLNELKDRNYDIDLVFLGDSITHYWESRGEGFWQEYYAHRKALNLGFAGDRTEHVLWRLQNKALDGVNAKLVVLLIGTNNTGHRQDPPEHTAMGIKAILTHLHNTMPEAKVLLLAIFPRGQLPDNPLRKINEDINKKISSFADDKRVFFLNINQLFLDENGAIPVSVMRDMLHPESAQYEIWAKAIEPYVQKYVD